MQWDERGGSNAIVSSPVEVHQSLVFYRRDRLESNFCFISINI